MSTGPRDFRATDKSLDDVMDSADRGVLTDEGKDAIRYRIVKAQETWTPVSAWIGAASVIAAVGVMAGIAAVIVAAIE
jgi:hypothetical protein